MTLQERLNAFYRMQLEDQPAYMHPGTMRLMRELEAALDKLEKEKSCLKARNEKFEIITDAVFSELDEIIKAAQK